MAELYNRTIEVYQYSTGVCVRLCVFVCVCVLCVHVYAYQNSAYTVIF